MTLWLPFAGVALVAALILLWPARQRAAGASMPDPLAHYRAQIAGLKADLENGLIDAASARAAEAEIGRRLLKAESEKASGTTPGTVSSGWRFRLALSSILVAGAAFLYGILGAPGVPPAIPERHQIADQPLTAGGPTFAEAIARIEAHLATHPDDPKALEYLGQTAATIGDFGRAATAFARRAELAAGEGSQWRVHELEALTALVEGQVSPAALLVLARLEKEAPAHPAVPYFRGIAALQAGDQATALAHFEAIVEGTDAPGPYRDAALARLRELGARPPAIGDEAVAAFAQMSEEERQAFIASMVARLEARLESAPNDPAGWLMLARARLTLGDRDAAIAVLRKGLGVIEGEEAAPLRALLDKLTESGEF